jgi:hypothetical protein
MYSIFGAILVACNASLCLSIFSSFVRSQSQQSPGSPLRGDMDFQQNHFCSQVIHDQKVLNGEIKGQLTIAMHSIYIHQQEVYLQKLRLRSPVYTGVVINILVLLEVFQIFCVTYARELNESSNRRCEMLWGQGMLQVHWLQVGSGSERVLCKGGTPGLVRTWSPEDHAQL